MNHCPYNKIDSRRPRGLYGRLRYLTLCACAGIFFVSGCGSTRQEDSPTLLRIGILSDRSLEDLQSKNSRLITYLAAECGVPTVMTPITGYDQLVEEFVKGNIDLACFGAYTFTQALQHSEAVPLVMRDVDQHFTTVFVARIEDNKATLEEFRGERLVFGNRLSTSGHVMPRHFLQNEGVMPESFFGDVSYSDTHSETVRMILEGAADLGAVNVLALEGMMHRGEIHSEDIQLVWQTPTYVDYVWAVPSTMPAKFRRRIRDSFLALFPTDPAHAAILADQGAGGYLPASMSDFNDIAAIAKQLSYESLSKESPQ